MLSAHAAWVHSPEAFQNFGAIGVATAVAYFGLQRHATSYPVGNLETLMLLQRRLNLLEAAAQRQSARFAILVKALREQAKSAGNDPLLELIALDTVDLPYIEEGLRASPDQADARLFETTRKQLQAEEQVSLARSRAEKLQLLVVVLATLQSGLGASIVRA
jgi:hypothetical protein